MYGPHYHRIRKINDRKSCENIAALLNRSKLGHLVHNTYFEMFLFNDYICRHLLHSSVNNVSSVYNFKKARQFLLLVSFSPDIRTTDHLLITLQHKSP